MATKRAPRADLLPPPQAVLLKPVLIAVPPAATHLHTLVSVGPDAREPWFERIGRSSRTIDDATNRVMANLTYLPESERGGAVRVAQSASLLGRLMLAAGRIATQGRVGQLESSCALGCRQVVALTENAARADFAARGSGATETVWRPGRVLLLMNEACAELDRLVDRMARSRPAIGSARPVVV